MDAYKLRSRYYEKHPNGHFFDHETLKFFGENMSSMRVWKDTVHVTDVCGEKHECYVLTSLQKKHPMGPRRVYHYFDVETFDNVWKEGA